MLAMGKCLEGCESKPFEFSEQRAEQRAAPEIAASRPTLLDAPLFSDAQRQEAAESMARRIEAEKTCGPDACENVRNEPSDRSNVSVASGQRKRRAPGDDHSMLHAHLSGGHAVPKRRPGRPRLSRPEGTTRAEGRDKKAQAEPEICAITHEPVNINAIKNLASRREAGFARVPGSNMTVREMVFYFLECCSRQSTYENGVEVGVLTVVWRESKCEQELGVKTRRYGGFEPFIFQSKERAGAIAEGSWRCCGKACQHVFLVGLSLRARGCSGGPLASPCPV